MSGQRDLSPLVLIQGTRSRRKPNGQLRQQRKTFAQTLGPDNKTADGVVKTRAAALNELQAQRAAWINEPDPNAGAVSWYQAKNRKEM